MKKHNLDELIILEQAATEAEAQDSGTSVVSDQVAGRRKLRGKVFSFRLTDTEIEALESYARAQGKPTSVVAREAVMAAVQPPREGFAESLAALEQDVARLKSLFMDHSDQPPLAA